MFLVYQEIGLTSILGLLVVAGSLFLNKRLSRLIYPLDKERKELYDQRASLMSEMIKGIKFIKFNTWEEMIGDKFQTIRDQELVYFKLMKAYEALGMSLNGSLPIICGMLCFGIYTLVLKRDLTIEQIFATLIYFSFLKAPLTNFSLLFEKYYTANVRLKKLNLTWMIPNYREEVDMNENQQLVDRLSEKADESCLEGFGITFEEFGCTWVDEDSKGKIGSIDQNQGSKDQKEEKLENYSSGTTDLRGNGGEEEGSILEKRRGAGTLRGVSLNLKRRESVCLIGQVGCGKSTLLKSVLRMTKTTEGSVTCKGPIAYISQTPFILNTTVRQNIIFGKEFEEDKYSEVVKVCQLETDIERLPGLDLTEIGERGVNLSGGQKQRLSIARALYSDSEVYLIDDCLSALDPDVGAKILEEAILGKLLKKKTVLMAINALSFLDQVDSICLLDHGKIIEQGSFEEIRSTPNYQKLIGEIKKQRNKDHKKHKESTKREENPPQLITGKQMLIIFLNKNFEVKNFIEIPNSMCELTMSNHIELVEIPC